MFARDLMSSPATVVTASDTVSHAAALMRQFDVGFLPVVQSFSRPLLLGVITDRDIAIRCVALQHGPLAKVGEHMTPAPIQVVSPDTPGRVLLELMKRHQVRRIPVVDDAGAVIGVIGQADVALKLGVRDPALVESVIAGISQRGILQEQPRRSAAM